MHTVPMPGDVIIVAGQKMAAETHNVMAEKFGNDLVAQLRFVSVVMESDARMLDGCRGRMFLHPQAGKHMSKSALANVTSKIYSRAAIRKQNT